MSCEPIVVIGIGQDGPAGLSPEAREHVARAAVLAGGRRHLSFFPEFHGQRIEINGDIPRVVEELKRSYTRAKTVVLASGDPLFFGVGAALVAALPGEALTFHPHVSSVQLAFARIKQSWQDATVVSLHGRPLESLLPALGDAAAKIAVLTDADNHPARIATFLVEQGYGEAYELWVCEDLGGAAERVTRWTTATIHEQVFSPLNVVVLLRGSNAARPALPLIGIPDEAILHGGMRRGMITKCEVRLASLAALELHRGDVLWDVGAGSGSVSLEAARLAGDLTVLAIEKSPPACAQIEENIRRFAVANVRAVAGEAPDVFQQLPDPQAVFIGGSGGRLAEIVVSAVSRLPSGGRLVMNCITIENFSAGWALFDRFALQPQVTSLQISRSKPLAGLHALEPDSPIFILRGTKP